MTPDKPVRLTVSAIRQRIFEVSGVPSQGAGSAAGQLFHRVAEQALDEAHPAYWRSVLTGELNADEWLGALYQHSLGPELTRQHALLRESGEEVLTLWRGVQSFARWFCGILSEAVRTGVLHYDGQAEQWVGGDSLFQSECELEAVFFLPDWTRPVVVSGRLDQVIRIAPDRCCVVEFKLGGGHAEADAAQACLYRELLGGDCGSAAIVRFGGEPEAHEILLAEASTQQARPTLLALIGALAGVSPHSGRDRAAASMIAVKAAQSEWPRKASAAELEIERKLLRALQEFGAEARSAGEPLVGPAFVRYLLEPGRGVPASRIEKQGPNLQMRLLLSEEPIIARAGGRIAVDVRRPEREFVSFGSLWTEIQAQKTDGGNSNAAAGVDINGQIHFIDLAGDCPHLLVGGTTGSGKSEWLRSAVASLLVTNDPDSLRLVLVDPKKNAFSELTGSPYLWRPDSLVDSLDGAALSWIEEMTEEMARRYEIFKQAGADDLARYRQKTGAVLPRVVCVVDEFADLLLAGGKRQRDDLERGFVRIAQAGRAAGLHLILATQRPSRQVVSGVLKANLPGKIALKVANRTDSGVLLDRGGAQNLLGKGDLLLSWGGDPVRLQSPWLSEEERVFVFRRAVAAAH
jgi:hypothetical protein